MFLLVTGQYIDVSSVCPFFLQVLGGVGLEWQLSHIFTSFKKEVNLDGGNTRGIPPAPDIIDLRVGTHRAF